MKVKKLLLPAIILSASVLVMAVVAVLMSIAQKPTVTEAEFPFSITYEHNGETVTISDVYRAYYTGNGGYANTKARNYSGEIGDMGEDNTMYTLVETAQGSVALYTNFHPDYLMGDSMYDYFDDTEFKPEIYCYDAEGQEYGDGESLPAYGLKLIDYDYPLPIKNSLVFSHISYLSGEIVIPVLLIALLALILTIIFVRKEKEMKYKAIDIVSIVLNVLISITLIPFVTLVAFLIDVVGGGPEFSYQALYFVPALSVLCTAASVALRRKGYGVISLIAELLVPVIFVVYLILSTVLG